jgi:hypothetical protein
LSLATALDVGAPTIFKVLGEAKRFGQAQTILAYLKYYFKLLPDDPASLWNRRRAASLCSSSIGEVLFLVFHVGQQMILIVSFTTIRFIFCSKCSTTERLPC